MRKLLPDATKKEKSMQKLMRQVESLEGKNAENVSGRMMYLQGLFEAAKDLSKRHSQAISVDVTKRIMSKHGQRWHQLTDQQKAHFEEAARAFRSESQEARGALLKKMTESLKE
eukprot:7270808-Lingulodinium_polyedra.AAC.1